MSGWRILQTLSITASIMATTLFPQVAVSQPAGARSESATPAAVEVPPELVEQILSDSPEAFSNIQSFLVGGGKRPEDVARRATALMSQIGGQKDGVGTDTLLKVIDRIASNAIDLVAGSQVVRVGIDENFIPKKSVLAWDFGPADGNVAEGFERILPGDPRIGGAGLDGLRRPADSGLLSDGITGVERIETNLPDGDYRVILLTQNLGDRALMANPFGSEIVVNGNAIAVAQPSPDQWVPDALFSNKTAGPTNIQAVPGGSSSFLTGDLSGVDPQVFARQQGGAIIIPAVAEGGKLIIELRGFGGSRSYITGMMVEPASEESELVLSPQARDSLVPPELRLALEENILAAAASVLADVDPAAGDPELVELPEPILDPEENASISS